MSPRLQSTMVAHGALVFLAGMAAGFPFAFVLLQKGVLWPLPALDWTPPGDVRGWRMAHLEGILNFRGGDRDRGDRHGAHRARGLRRGARRRAVVSLTYPLRPRTTAPGRET
jgi:hypothetical protein